MRSSIAASVLAFLLFAASCGQERVDLSAAAGYEADGGGAACDATSICTENGGRCTAGATCCSARCESGFCLPPGTCGGPGSTCSSRTACCSGRCESSGSDRVCGPFCRADGSSCEQASDCCALDCNGGTCGGAVCKVVGTACSSDGECCSKSCDNSVCVLDSSTVCRPSGEGCAGGDVEVGCCSGVCNATTQRCDLGPGPCREPGTPCEGDGDCCRGSCASGTDGVSVCSAACLSDGQDCNSDGDCCGGVCAGTPARCASTTNTCGG